MNGYQNLWIDFKKQVKDNTSKTNWGKTQILEAMDKAEMAMLRDSFKKNN